MKKSLLILTVLLTFIHYADATTLTVSNSPAGGAQYASLQAAYTDAVNGDTLLLEGTDIAYYLNGQQHFNKSLTLIGIGTNPDKQLARKTRISTSYYSSFTFVGGASGSSFYGITFNNEVSFQASVNNIIFENCAFNHTFNFNHKPSTDFTFRNCIFNRNNAVNVYLGGSNSVCIGTFFNCIFDGYIDGQVGQFVNATIDHCLFLNTSTNAFFNLYYVDVRNCIFLNTFPANIHNSTFTNNLCNVAGSFPPQPENGNTGSGNIENTDPLLTSYTLGSLYHPTHDYNLQAGSPAIDAGSDLTDIGVHGGYSGFSKTGEVLITPIVRSLNILNSTVEPNGSLTVEIHATAPNNN